MTLDVGHVVCTEAGPAVDEIEDISGRRHEHLPFGEGKIDFPPILAAFRAAGYRGYLGVELSRHSHEAERRATESLAFLRRS